MGTTVFLDTPMNDETEIDCESAKLMGNIVWAISDGNGPERVIPVSNVTGIEGDVVEQEVEEVEYPGGRVTELVTRLSPRR